MFIKLKGQSYYFLNASVDVLNKTIEMEVQSDKNVVSLEIRVEGSERVALQTIASTLSKYTMVSDIDSELSSRGIYIKTVVVKDINAITKQKEPLGVERTELLNETVAISVEGVYVIKELAMTLDGVYILHTKGYTKLLDRELITDAMYEHLLNEIKNANNEKTIYVVS